MQRPQSQVANRLSKMLLLSSIIFYAMAVDGQFVVTRKTEETINYAQTIEYHKITKTALKDEISEMKKYAKLGEERTSDIRDRHEEECGAGDAKCGNHDAVDEAPSEISLYNGYEVRKVTSKMDEALSQCDDGELITPDSEAELEELKTLMKKKGTTIQPIKVAERGNYVMYRKGEVINDKLGSTTASSVTSAAVEYQYLGLTGDKLQYVSATHDGTEISFLCLFKRDDIETDKDEYINRLARIEKRWQDAAKIIDEVYTKLQICEPNEKEIGGSDIKLRNLDFNTNLTSAYRRTERLSYAKPSASVWREVEGALDHVITLGLELLEGATNCVLYQCKAAMGTRELELKCDRSKSIKGKGVYFHSFPFSTETGSFMLYIDHVITDYSYQYCFTTVNTITWNLDPRCCEEIDSVTAPSTPTKLKYCPIIELANAPLVIDHGPYKQLTVKDAIIDAKCGTKKEKYKPMGGSVATFYGDCKVNVANEHMSTQIAGFGKKLLTTGLEKIKEDAGMFGSMSSLGVGGPINIVVWTVLLIGIMIGIVFLCRSKRIARNAIQSMGCISTACCAPCKTEDDESKDHEDATPRCARRRNEPSDATDNLTGFIPLGGIPYNLVRHGARQVPNAPNHTLTGNN